MSRNGTKTRNRLAAWAAGHAHDDVTNPRRCGCSGSDSPLGFDVTTPEEDGSDRQDCKSWDGAGKKEQEYSVAALVTSSQQAVVSDIACATPATEPSAQRRGSRADGVSRCHVSQTVGWLLTRTSYRHNLGNIGTTSRRQHRHESSGTGRSEARRRLIHCLGLKAHQTCTLPQT